MAFAGAWRSQEVQRLAPLDELELGERQDAVAIEARLEAEVIAREGLDRAQPCRLQRHLDASGLPGGEFFPEKCLECIEHGGLALFEPMQGGIQRFQRARHLQADKMALDALESGSGNCAHCGLPCLARCRATVS